MKDTLKELLENDIKKYQYNVKKSEQRLSLVIGSLFIAIVTVIYLSVSYVKHEKTIDLMKNKHFTDSIAIKSKEDNYRMGDEIRRFNNLNR